LWNQGIWVYIAEKHGKWQPIDGGLSMSMQTLVLVLAVWTVVGLLAAIAFGHLIPFEDRDEAETPVGSTTHNVKYFRRNKRVTLDRPASRKAVRRGIKRRNGTL
jgi:hypothetical protein